MRAPIPASLATILPAVKAQLSLVTGSQLTRIRLVARKGTPKFIADQDILVKTTDINPDPGFEHGSGRTCIIIRRPLLIIPRTRLQTDASDQDDNWLLDSSRGHIVLEEKILNG